MSINGRAGPLFPNRDKRLRTDPPGERGEGSRTLTLATFEGRTTDACSVAA